MNEEETRAAAIAAQPDPGYGVPPPGHRLPSGTRLGLVRLQVAHLGRSLDYYQRVIGLRVLARADGAATLGPYGDPTPLIELHEQPGAVPVPRRGRLGLYHFAILLPDRPALGRLVRQLAETGIHAGMSDHLVSEAIYLSDPDGLGIEVCADRPRSGWRAEDRQLVMHTEPLDADDLAAAAGDEWWAGVPAGTTIGHVHLFVAHLAQAEAFYHRALGFDKMVWSYPGALFLSAGGYHHHLGVNTWARGAAMAGEHDARLLEWTIELPAPRDAEAAAESMRQSGYRTDGGAGEYVLTDPWGTRLRVRSSQGS